MYSKRFLSILLSLTFIFSNIITTNVSSAAINRNNGSQETTTEFNTKRYAALPPIDRYLEVTMKDTQKPDIWGTWNGVSAMYLEGKAEDGISEALHITGGTVGAGTQLAFISGNFNNFIGFDAFCLRVKSTSSFYVSMRLEYRASNVNKDSKRVFVPSTNGEWMDIYITAEDLKPDVDGDWIYNMKSGYTTNFEPAILMRFEQTNFGASNYATIGNIKALWYADVITHNITFIADNETVDTKTVNDGEALTDIPPVPEKEGYTGVWDITDFSNITSNTTVTAVYTKLPTAFLPLLKEVEPGTEITIPITLSDLPAGIKSFDFGLIYDSNNLIYQSFVKGDGYTSEPEVNSNIAGKLGVAGLTTETGVGGNQEIIKLRFKVKTDAQIVKTALVLSNVKYGNSNNANKVITSDRITNGSIEIFSLALAKQAAKLNLNEVYNGYHPNKYSPANWTILTNAKLAGDTAIDNATTSEQVITAENNAIEAMAAVKTKAQEAVNKIRTGQFNIDDIKDTGANNIVDANFHAYRLGLNIQKEFKDDEDLEMEDIEYVIEVANSVTPDKRGDIIHGEEEEGIFANDAAAVRGFIVRQNKPVITLEQVIKADYDNDGDVNVVDIINILIKAAQNNVPK